MGNATKPNTRPVNKRNLEPVLASIRQAIAAIISEARTYQATFKRISQRINSGNFYEQDLVVLNLIRNQMRQLVADKTRLERQYMRVLREMMSQPSRINPH